MQSVDLEFAELLGHVEYEHDTLVLTGQPYQAPVRVGDRFHLLIDSQGATHEINLGVADIRCYGTFLLQLDRGLTGRLFLIGDSSTDLFVDADSLGWASVRSDPPG